MREGEGEGGEYGKEEEEAGELGERESTTVSDGVGFDEEASPSTKHLERQCIRIPLTVEGSYKKKNR